MVAMVDETQSDQPGPEQSKPDETSTLSRPTLCRRPDEGWVAGVCAGIADALGVPAWTIRAATILVSFTGFGIVAYVLAALTMRDTNGARIIDRRGTKELVLYAAVAIVGWVTLPEMIFGSELKGRVNVLSSMFPWLLLLGGLALVLRTGPGDRATTPMPMDAPPQPASPPPTTSTASAFQTAADPKASSGQPIGSGLRWVGQHFPVLGPVVFLATLALAALLVGLGAPVGVVGGIGIVALGAAMLVASKRGRARGLVIPAAVLTLIATPAVAAGVRLETIGAPEFVQATATSAPADIHAYSGGTTVVDLLDLQVDGDLDRTYEVGEGRIIAILPAHMKTIVEADVSRAGGDVVVQRPSTDYFLDTIGTKERILSLDEIRKNRLVDRNMLNRLTVQLGSLDYGDPSETSVLGGIPRTTIDFRSFQHQRATYEPARRAAMESGNELPKSAGTLRLRLRAGRGEVAIVEPIWSTPPNVPDQKPTQVCAAAGGAVGVVKSCDAIKFERRVPTCLLQPAPMDYSSYVVRWHEPAKGMRQEDLVASLSNTVGDCRELAKAKAEDGATPKVVLLACSDGAAYLGCTGIGIANDTPIPVAETTVILGNSGYMVPASTIPPVQSSTSDRPADSPATVPPIGSSAPSTTTGQPTTTALATTAPITTAQGAN